MFSNIISLLTALACVWNDGSYRVAVAWVSFVFLHRITLIACFLQAWPLYRSQDCGQPVPSLSCCLLTTFMALFSSVTSHFLRGSPEELRNCSLITHSAERWRRSVWVHLLLAGTKLSDVAAFGQFPWGWKKSKQAQRFRLGVGRLSTAVSFHSRAEGQGKTL